MKWRLRVKIAVVGSRSFSSRRQVDEWLDKNIKKTDVVVSGGADGPDSWAEEFAKKRGIPTIIKAVDKQGLPPYPAGRSEFRVRAFARNREIVVECDRVVAFVDPDSPTKGTADTLAHAVDLKKPFEVIYPEPKAS